MNELGILKLIIPRKALVQMPLLIYFEFSIVVVGLFLVIIDNMFFSNLLPPGGRLLLTPGMGTGMGTGGDHLGPF